MFSKFKYIGFSFVLLAGSSICSQALSAMDVEQDVGRGPSRTQLTRFINGQKQVQHDEVSSWVSHSFHWLEDLYNRANNMKDRAKAALGFAHLSSQYRNVAFPGMDSLASTRYSLGLLQNMIDANSSLDEDVDFKKYRNHARVFWGELAIYNLNGFASEDELNAAWGFLGEIDGGYTKIGKVYQAELLLNRGYRPIGVENGDVNGLAGQLLNDSYSHGHAARLQDQLRIRTQATPQVEIEEEEVDAQPCNLHSQKARKLRKRLELQLVREEASYALNKESELEGVIAETSASSHSVDVREESLHSSQERDPASKRQRVPDEDLSKENDAIAWAEPIHSASDSESSSESSEQPGRKRKSPEVRSWKKWSDEQEETFKTLWNDGVKGQVLCNSIWSILSDEQKAQFSGAQDEKFIWAIGSKRQSLNLPKRVKRQKISDEEINQFLLLIGEKSKKEILQIMHISSIRYRVLYNKAKRDGKI